MRQNSERLEQLGWRSARRQPAGKTCWRYHRVRNAGPKTCFFRIDLPTLAQQLLHRWRVVLADRQVQGRCFLSTDIPVGRFFAVGGSLRAQSGSGWRSGATVAPHQESPLGLLLQCLQSSLEASGVVVAALSDDGRSRSGVARAEEGSPSGSAGLPDPQEELNRSSRNVLSGASCRL